MAFKMNGFSGFGNSPLKQKPIATKKKSKEKPGDVKLDPGFEDPLKIQKLQRKGLIPGSQKFSDKAFLKSQREEEVKRSDLDEKGKKIWDKHRKKSSPGKFLGMGGGGGMRRLLGMGGRGMMGGAPMGGPGAAAAAASAGAAGAGAAGGPVGGPLGGSIFGGMRGRRRRRFL